MEWGGVDILSLKQRACRPKAGKVSSPGTCIPRQLGVDIVNSMTSKIPVTVFAATSLKYVGHCYWLQMVLHECLQTMG